MEMLTYRDTAEQVLRITRAAARAKLTRSEFIRQAVRAAIDQQRATDKGQPQ